jgi:hypothetical protein
VIKPYRTHKRHARSSSPQLGISNSSCRQKQRRRSASWNPTADEKRSPVGKALQGRHDEKTLASLLLLLLHQSTKLHKYLCHLQRTKNMCSPEATKSLLDGYNSLFSFSPSFSALSGAPRHYCYKFLRQFHGDGYVQISLLSTKKQEWHKSS